MGYYGVSANSDPSAQAWKVVRTGSQLSQTVRIRGTSQASVRRIRESLLRLNTVQRIRPEHIYLSARH
ncbi:hypothetical protein KQH60_07270 [Mycetohabitans sp. B8]|uniref:hypothetical protein n=1 Tax=Mycetohabitans sp. B8 TaxID=2841845 RepID=UPI001F216E12|nr:hypothetical protein [Mycetohabitans sp. B8]MCG1042365.1 hypothetical protein [Mycetohabitans sp. B8]